MDLTKINDYMKLAGGWEIFRRYFVLNAFDGLLTVFGIVLSGYLIGIDNPTQIIGPGMGASIAIGVSGVWIAFLTEDAEQAREQKRVEKMIFVDLENTMYAKASKTATIINSTINGLSPFMFGFTLLIPFFMVELSMITMHTAYIASLISSGLLLFILGILLGKSAKTNIWIFGIKTLTAGLLVAILLYFTGLV